MRPGVPVLHPGTEIGQTYHRIHPIVRLEPPCRRPCPAKWRSGLFVLDRCARLGDAQRLFVRAQESGRFGVKGDIKWQSGRLAESRLMLWTAPTLRIEVLCPAPALGKSPGERTIQSPASAGSC